MLPTREHLLSKAESLPATPVAFEAFWDGDTTGWYVVLAAVIRDVDGFRHYDLGTMRGDGGDMRIFNGQVPPWPEAKLAAEVGVELAERFGVPFDFAHPNEPTDSPPWWERHRQ